MAESIKEMTPAVSLDTEESSVSMTTTEMDSRIAEIAYYKAERRGFAPGYELEDWLEAEQEVKQEWREYSGTHQT